MKKITQLVFLFLIFLSTGFEICRTNVVGSWGNVSRHTDVVFPAAADSNKIQGFSFVNSFTLEGGGATTCTFNSVMPVRGDVYLNDGTLFLEQDLIFRNGASIASAGKFECQGHIIEFAESMDELQLSELLGTDILNIAQIPADNNEDINTVGWSYDDKYVAVGTDGQVNNYEMYVYEVKDDELVDQVPSGASYYDSDAPYFYDDELQNVRWHPSAYYLAAVATEEETGASTWDYEFRLYEFDPNDSFPLDIRYRQDFGVDVKAVTWRPDGNWLVVGTANSTYEIWLYQFNAGTGTVSGGSESQRFALPQAQSVGKGCLDWDSEGNYLAAGLTQNASGDELVIYHFNGTSFNTTPTVSINIGETVSALDWHPTDSLIVVGLSSGTERFRLYEFNDDTWTLEEKTGARIGETGTVSSVHWKPDGLKLVMTRAVDGTFDAGDPLTTELRVYDFNSTTKVFSYIHGLNSGIGLNEARWAHSGTRIAVVTERQAVSGGKSYTIIYDLLEGTLYSRDIHLYLNSDLYLRTPLSFLGDNFIDTRGNKIIITDNGAINVKPNSTLRFEGGRILLDKPGIFSLEDETSKVIFENTQIELSNDAFIAQGTVDFDGNVVIKGPYEFTYASPYAATIKQFSSLSVIDDATFKTGLTPGLTAQPLILEDHSSSLIFNNASFSITDSGLQLTKGSLDIIGRSQLSVESTVTNDGLVLGNGAMDYDVTLSIRAGSTFEVANGSLVIDSYLPNDMLFLGNDAELSLIDSSKLYVKGPLALDSGSLYLGDSATVEKEATAYITTNKFRVHDRYQDFILTGTLNNADSLLLDQNDELILRHGNLSKTITVSRGNNIMHGDGQISGNVLFVDGNSSLTWSIDAKLDEYSLILNNGVLALERDLDFYKNLGGFVVGDDVTLSGTIALDNHIMKISANDSVWTGSFYFSGNGAQLQMRAKVSLSGTWTIDGNVTIDGNGQTLHFDDSAEMYVAPGATLTLRNMLLDDLSGTQLQALADSSQIIFDNVGVVQDGDFSFDTGSMLFRNDVTFIGGAGCSDETTYSFSYNSDQTSAIDENSTLHILRGLRFEIGNPPTGGIIPLAFAGQTSVLHLDEGMLRVVDDGLELKCGRMRVSNSSILNVDTTYGVTLGDGAVASNDFIVEIEGDAKLSINNGIMYYNNMSPEDRIVFVGDDATLRINCDDGLTALRTVLLRHGTLSFPTQVTGGLNPHYLATVGSAVIDQDHVRHIHDIPYSSHIVQGQFQTGLGYLFVDDGFVAVTSGQTTEDFVFDSGTSSLVGVGVIGSTLRLVDKNATVIMGLESELNSDIELNGGTLNLATHLYFVSDKTITGSGTIVLNNNSFYFGTDELSLTHTILWQAPSTINLGAKTSLSGTWTVRGDGGINGHGNILDLSETGRIVIDEDATIFLSDIVIKGLGDDLGQFIFMNDDSQLRMSNVSIVLESDYSTTIGGVYVEGPSTWYMDDYDWSFEQRGSLTVDGMTLWKDSLDKLVVGGITFDSPDLLSLLNSGTIKTTTNADWVLSATTILGDEFILHHGDIDIIYSYLSTIDHGPTNIFFDGNQTVTYNIYLGPTHTMNLQDDMVLSGSSWYIHFSRADEPLLFIDAGKTVTLQNIVLKDFSPDYVSFGDANSELVFGDGTTIELFDDITLSRRWTFTGDARIRGLQSKITLQTGGQLDVYDHSQLTLEDLTISGLGEVSEGLRARTNDGVIIVKDSELALTGCYTFSYGSIIFEHDAKISGMGTFVYATDMSSTILSESKLFIDTGVTFSYDPPAANRDLLVMTDATSILHLNGAMLYSTPTGLRLTDGMVLFDNMVTLSAEGLVVDEAISLGDVVMALGGAYVEAYGYIDVP